MDRLGHTCVALGTPTCHASCPCAYIEEVLVMVSPVSSIMCYVVFLFLVWNQKCPSVKDHDSPIVQSKFHVRKGSKRIMKLAIDQLHYVTTLKTG